MGPTIDYSDATLRQRIRGAVDRRVQLGVALPQIAVDERPSLRVDRRAPDAQRGYALRSDN